MNREEEERKRKEGRGKRRKESAIKTDFSGK